MEIGSKLTNSWLDSIVDSFNGVDSDRRRQFNRIGTATRAVIESVVASKAPTEQLGLIADAIEKVAEDIGRFPSGRVYEGFAEAANTGGNGGFMDFSPISGAANPIAPPVELSLSSDPDGSPIVVGVVTFGSAYEGPPGSVHGGHIAAAFDEVLGLAQSMSGSPGMTARLSVNYRKPTPLGEPLTFVARIVKKEGKKVFTEGKCYFGDILTAEADALFISVDFSKLAQLAGERERTNEGQKPQL